MRAKKSLFRKIVIFLNTITIIAYLATCLCPFINTSENWLLAFPGLVFPFICIILVVFIIYWLIVKSRWWWVSLIILLLGCQQIMAVFGFQTPQKFLYEKGPNTLRVIQWNVTSWDEGSKKAFGGSSYRIPMLGLVQNQQADVLCFQEFFEPKDTGYYKSNFSSLSAFGFTHHFFVPLSNADSNFETGIAIFSKYPIADTARFTYKLNYTGEHLVYCDINTGNHIFRVFSTHLQPVYFDEDEYKISNWMNPEKETDFGFTRSLFSRLKRGFQYRYYQALLVNKIINESPYPCILCGDFNDLPNSSTYFITKGNLQDAFIKAGSGFGRTIPFFSPTLRIDYIFADKTFLVTQFKVIHVPYSNHYPLVTDLRY